MLICQAPLQPTVTQSTQRYASSWPCRMYILISVETADFHGMLNSIMAYGLFPRDALHVTGMQRVRLTVIASDDPDFDRVATLTRHWVINPPTNA